MSELGSVVRPSLYVIKGAPIMSKIPPCLWFNREAEEAAKFYVSLLPDSRTDRVQRSPVDNPRRQGWHRAGGQFET